MTEQKVVTRPMVRLTDIVKAYDGTGDFSEWSKKLENVAKLQGVDDLAAFMPLFLCGGAFAVYEGLTEECQSDYGELKMALNKAFSPNPLKAYSELCNRKLHPGESVDVYGADIKRLASLVAQNTELDEGWLKCAFTHGLPLSLREKVGDKCGAFHVVTLIMWLSTARK